jgi:hypothetical protein
MYDLIGDIHGYAGHLQALLEKLGYRVESGASLCVNLIPYSSSLG